jgi:formamidopyrimidine-DNA glycosylase
MPELPEVEVVRLGLDRVVRGRTVTRVEVSRDRAVRREPDAAAFVTGVAGRAVVATSRIGKFLVLHLDDRDSGADGDEEVVIVHLGMSGQLRVADDAAMPREKHTHVVLGLDDGREVRFVDPRTFGQVYRSRVLRENGTRDSARPLALAHLGPDALDEVRSPADLALRFAARRVAVKTRLMDQQAIAGLGNIYSDEILFRAGVLGGRASGSLSDAEIARIHDASATVLRDAIAARGSSLADAQYVDLFGQVGEFQHAHAVHARHGQPCVRCGATVQRARTGGRYGYWCPVCQT